MQWLALILVLPYLWLFLGIYRGLKKINRFIPEHHDNEFISVIIACRNEEKNIARLLKDLSAQIYPNHSFEVIVVDDNSTDKTYLLASSFEGIRNLNVIRNNESGKKAAIRTGVGTAKGTLIVTTDADCTIGPKWLQTISSFSFLTSADLIVSPVILENGAGFPGKFAELEFLSLQGVTAGTLMQGSGILCNGSNLAFRREAYYSNIENLHFEIPSGDDIFLLHSMKRNNASKILWLEAMESAVRTVSPESPGKFFRQRGRWISKAPSINDPYSVITGIVTFVTISNLIASLFAALLDYKFLYIYLAVTLLKSIPDYLIIKNTAERYNKKGLMLWFLPSQIFYPFYVLISVIYGFLSPQKWN